MRRLSIITILTVCVTFYSCPSKPKNDSSTKIEEIIEKNKKETVNKFVTALKNSGLLIQDSESIEVNKISRNLVEYILSADSIDINEYELSKSTLVFDNVKTDSIEGNAWLVLKQKDGSNSLYSALYPQRPYPDKKPCMKRVIFKRCGDQEFEGCCMVYNVKVRCTWNPPMNNCERSTECEGECTGFDTDGIRSTLGFGF